MRIIYNLPGIGVLVAAFAGGSIAAGLNAPSGLVVLVGAATAIGIDLGYRVATRSSLSEWREGAMLYYLPVWIIGAMFAVIGGIVLASELSHPSPETGDHAPREATASDAASNTRSSRRADAGPPIDAGPPTGHGSVAIISAGVGGVTVSAPVDISDTHRVPVKVYLVSARDPDLATTVANGPKSDLIAICADDVAAALHAQPLLDLLRDHLVVELSHEDCTNVSPPVLLTCDEHGCQRSNTR